MRGAKPVDMTVDQLLARFAVIGVDQDKALLRMAISKFNRLFDEMVAIENELKRRPGDQGTKCFDSTNIPMPRSG